jgi:hypothetical protein
VSEEIARKLFEVARDYFFLQRVSELKIGYIVSSIQDAITRDNPTTEFVLLRSLVEHISALSFEVDTICALLEKLAGQNSEQRIRELLDSSHRTLERLFYGESPAKNPKIKQFHVNDFIRSLTKRVNNIEMMYDYLCEFVHPNYGSNLLVSTGKLGAGRLDPPADIHAEHITRACTCVLRVLIEVECLVSSGGAALLRLDNYITIAMRPNQAAGAIFSVQTLTHEGDGKTKASAIFFTKARTPQEAVEMIYRHLEGHGIEITGPKMHGGIEAGFIFDIFQTTQGKVWFKTAMLKI